MSAFDTDAAAAQIGVGQHWISFSPVGQCLDVAIRGRGLEASWRSEAIDSLAAAKSLQALHDSLSGEAWLGDNGSFAVTFAVGTRGQITAEVHVEGWPFQMQGHLDFAVEVDHTQLGGLAKRLRGRLP